MRFADDPAKEDYSLRYAPKAFRTWKPWQVYVAAIGSLAAMAGYALGGGFAESFGAPNALMGEIISSAVIFVTGIPLALAIARHNIDIDLLTRGSGFGYLGSTITSLVYATFTLIFVAFEGSIMAQALSALAPIPIRLSYVVVSLSIIPLVIYGMRFTAKFQAITQPIWVLLVLLAVGAVAVKPGVWTALGSFHGPAVSSASMAPLAVGAVAAALLSGVAQIGEQGDYLRFMPERSSSNRRSWLAAVLLGGPGWVLIGIFAFVAGMLLTTYAAPKVGMAKADVPVTMFQLAFARLVGNGHVALVIAALFVILSQVKINIMNAYSGSLSWSNFFSRILHRHPGRVVWLVFQVLVGLAIMEAGIFGAIGTVLAVYSNVAVAWIGCLISDIVVNGKLLGLRPAGVEFKRAHLHNFNPVGFGSMIAASAVALAAYFGAFGHVAAVLSSFIALAAAFVMPPVVAFATGSRYYVARTSVPDPADALEHLCVRCSRSYESMDMAHCPFHSGNICSLCCSVESACHDACKVLGLHEPLGSTIRVMPGSREATVEGVA